LKYKHEEKLSLVFVLEVQKLHHYILLHTTKVIADSNPMQYLLNRRKINGKFARWIVIHQEYDIEFSTPKRRNISSSPNLSRPSPLIILVPLSIPTSPMNISFISLQMILGMKTSSSTSEPKSSVTTSHRMIIIVFTTRPPTMSSLEISYIDEGSTPYFNDA
jgi:hypothetical protein